MFFIRCQRQSYDDHAGKESKNKKKEDMKRKSTKNPIKSSIEH